MHCFYLNKLLRFSAVISLIGKCDNNYNNSNKNQINSKRIVNQNINSMDNQLSPDLSIYSMTWNIKSELPKCDLTQLLNIRTEMNETINSLADIYVIGLQEVPLKASNLIFTEPWTQAFDNLLKQLNFVRLKSIRLVGVLLLVYTKRQLLPNFRSIQVQYTRTGFGGLWGNKGGVSLSVIFDGISICFVNSHLAAHYEQLEQRISDYNTIIDSQYFTNTQKVNILSHDYVIWIGDLNFRIDDLTGDQIHDIILNAKNSKSDNKYEKLLEKDQLNRVRREGHAFSEFTETVPTFPPTYKFFVNTDNYDYKSRKPAFTDRILYRFTPNAYEDYKLDLKQIDYKSHPQYKQSDHKPVSALFRLKTKKSVIPLLTKRSTLSVDSHLLPSNDALFVTFLPITDWKVNTDSNAWYTITPNDENSLKKLSNWDWIGLYKADFMSTEEHISHVWANSEPTRWSPPNRLTNTDSSSDSSSEDDPQRAPTRPEPWFSLTFSDQNLLIADQFRLVYITQDGDVLGISEPFIVSN